MLFTLFGNVSLDGCANLVEVLGLGECGDANPERTLGDVAELLARSHQLGVCLTWNNDAEGAVAVPLVYLGTAVDRQNVAGG